MSFVFLRGQITYMRDRGFEIHAVSSAGPEIEAFEREEGVPVTVVDMPRRLTPLRDLAAVLRLCRVIQALRPDIVHAHTPKGGLLGMIAATITRVPVRIYHMRGLPFTTATGMRRWLLERTERLACALAQSVLCVGQSMRDIAIGARVCDARRIRVLANGSGNGVDAHGRFDPVRLGSGAGAETRNRLGIPETAVVLGFVGRIVRDKGIIELAEAWRLLRTRWPAAYLLIVGPAEDQDAVPASVVAELRGDARVHFTGLDYDVAPLYAAMDIVVLPTYREGFPNVPLEAAAMALPIVATRVPGCTDAVRDGVTGLLVPSGEVAPLVTAIERYLAEPALRRAHGQAARAWVEAAFLPESIWHALHGEYQRLLRSAGYDASPRSETSSCP